MYALGGKTETGTIRVTFFTNQASVNYSLQYPKKGDFLTNGRIGNCYSNVSLLALNILIVPFTVRPVDSFPKSGILKDLRLYS